MARPLSLDQFVESLTHGRKDFEGVTLLNPRDEYEALIVPELFPRLDPKYTRGLNLSNAHLTGFNFNNSDFSGSNFNGASVCGSSFNQANMEGVSLRNAYLADPSFEGIPYGSASFSAANLRRSDLSGSYASGIDFSGADLTYALLGADTSWSNEALNEVLRQSTHNLGCLDRESGGAVLTDADFQGANLTCVDIRSLYLGGVDLRNADLSGIKAYKTFFHNAKFNGGTIIKAGDFTNAFFDESRFSNVDFSHGQFPEAYFSETLFEGYTNFQGANLHGANFGIDYKEHGAIFETVDFRGADLQAAKFLGAKAQKVLNDGNIPGLTYQMLITDQSQ